MAESHAEEKKEEPKVQAPVLKVDLDSNVEDSVAYSLLDDWAKKLGKRQATDATSAAKEVKPLPCPIFCARTLPREHCQCRTYSAHTA